jgi:hypothetical protein
MSSYLPDITPFIILILAAVIIYVLMRKVTGPSFEDLRSFFVASAPFVAFSFVALTFVAIIGSVFYPYLFVSPGHLDKTLLQQLADTEAARGLITFLVAVTTVGIAVILIVWMASVTGTAPEDKERFAFGKEILTSLIGILGTIIGFYFGATLDQTHSRGPSAALTIASLSIAPPTPAKGDTVTLQATLSGGRPPYKFAIRFTPDTINEIVGQSPNGTISQAIKLDTYDPTKSLDITLEGTDATGATGRYQMHFAPAQIPPGSGGAPSQNRR